jgi:uncharacterized protein YbgA (DUF1722 family)/uncharacterized protein YbbK (DUF523 family)
MEVIFLTRIFEKPTILLSKCIEHEPCRYDKTMIKSEVIRRLMPYVKYITVCPESDIGLPIPRQALRIIVAGEDSKLVFSKSGEDITDKMKEFSHEFLKSISSQEIHGAILKSRSPSCGIKDVKIYKSCGKSCALSQKTSGLFAESFIEKHPDIPIEDEGRLTNYNIREHFFTRIFTLADYKSIKDRKSINELIKFQSKNKYLLMAHSPGNLKTLGKLTANNSDLDISEIFDTYECYLNKALANRPSPMRNVNMLLHLFGYFSKDITKDEKVFFLDNLESYADKKVPFSVPLAIIHAWVIRFENEYLLNQTIFEAFPSELIEVTDSGKGL